MVKLMVLLWLTSSCVVAATPSPRKVPDASSQSLAQPQAPELAQTKLTPGLMLQAQGMVGESPVKAWRDGEMSGNLRRVRPELNLALAWQPLNTPYAVRGELVRYLSFSASQPAREDNALRLLVQWLF